MTGSPSPCRHRCPFDRIRLRRILVSSVQTFVDEMLAADEIVLRPLVEEYDEEIGGRLSFKPINPKFLLKYDE